jgi:hypothetical protein
VPSDSESFNNEHQSIEPSDNRLFNDVYRNRRDEARSEPSDSRTFNEEYRNRYRIAQNEHSDNNRLLNNEYRNDTNRDRTGSTGARSPRGEYRNEYDYDRLATSGRRRNTVRNEVGSGTGSGIPIYRDRNEFEQIGFPSAGRSDTHRGRGSASDRHLSQTPRGRSPSLEHGVRFQEDYRPQWSLAMSLEYYQEYDVEDRRGTTLEPGKVGVQ